MKKADEKCKAQIKDCENLKRKAGFSRNGTPVIGKRVRQDDELSGFKTPTQSPHKQKRAKLDSGSKSVINRLDALNIDNDDSIVYTHNRGDITMN